MSPARERRPLAPADGILEHRTRNGIYYGPFALIARMASPHITETSMYSGPLAAVYRGLASEYAHDVDFFVGVARSAVGPVLDLASGYGRLSLPLADAGLEVEAWDTSQAMLDELRGRVDSRRSIAVVRRDLYELPDEQIYGLIVVGAGMFSTFLASGGARWLAGLRSALRAGGTLCFDTNDVALSPGSSTVSSRLITLERGEALCVIGTFARTGCRTSNVYVEGAEEKPLLATETLTDLTHGEIDRQLERAGFGQARRIRLDATSTGWIVPKHK